MKRLRIVQQILIVLLFAVIIPFVTVGLIISNVSQQSVRRELNYGVTQISSYIADTISSHIAASDNEFGYIAAAINEIPSRNLINKYLTEIEKKSDKYSSLEVTYHPKNYTDDYTFNTDTKSINLTAKIDSKRYLTGELSFQGLEKLIGERANNMLQTIFVFDDKMALVAANSKDKVALEEVMRALPKNRKKNEGVLFSKIKNQPLAYFQMKDPNWVVVVMTNPSVTKYHKRTLYDLFYNDFLYDNSKGKIRIKVGTVEPVAFQNYELVSLTDELLRPYSDGSLRNLILKVSGFSSFNVGKLTGPDGNEMDTEAFLASLKVFAAQAIEDATGEHACFEQYEGIPFRIVTQKYGKGIVEEGVDAEGCIYLDLDLAKPVRKQGATMDGYIGIEMPAAAADLNDMFKVAWSQYDSLELETEIGEVSFKLDSVTVSVEERKLRATWSPELAQDVSAFHNIDAEAELTALLSEQIAAEIDREILRDIRKLAPWQARWDVNGWRRQAGFSTNYTQKDWNQELITKINQISAQINKATLRGGASWVVVSAEISALFDNLEYFHVSDASAESDQYNMGIERIGALQNRYQVYRDPYSPAWSIIIGHRGKSLLDTGYIYAPYIPLQLTPTIYNPHNFAPVKGIMTRYAKKCVNSRYFGGVKVDGLVQWDPQELR